MLVHKVQTWIDFMAHRFIMKWVTGVKVARGVMMNNMHITSLWSFKPEEVTVYANPPIWPSNYFSVAEGQKMLSHSTPLNKQSYNFLNISGTLLMFCLENVLLPSCLAKTLIWTFKHQHAVERQHTLKSWCFKPHETVFFSHTGHISPIAGHFSALSCLVL